MKAAMARKKTEVMQDLLISAQAGIMPDEKAIERAKQLGIDTDAVMEVFYVANGDD